MKHALHLRRRTRHPSTGITTATLLAVLLAVSHSIVPVSARQAPSPRTLTEASEAVEAVETTETDATEHLSTADDVRTALSEQAMSRTATRTVGVDSRITYRYPSGAMAVTLFIDGQRAMTGEVVDIGGVVYVPVQRFADRLGSFRTTYNAATEHVVITGTDLKITVRVGDPYITVNDRILYTGHNVLSLGGWIFVPIESMAKAVGATVWIRQGWYQAYVTSGDPTAVAHASEVYDEGELYWLSRIISAEAQGESLQGRIAVGNVVLNRRRSSSFPNTIYGVIFDKKYGTQFAPTANGTIYKTPTDGSVLAAKICLEGYTLSNQILYFFNPAYASGTWIVQTRPYIMTIGNHKFYG